MYIITDFTKFIILLFSVFKPLTNNGGGGLCYHLPSAMDLYFVDDKFHYSRWVISVESIPFMRHGSVIRCGVLLTLLH